MDFNLVEMETNYQLTITDKEGNSIKYYHHPVFTDYCANANGDIVSTKRDRIKQLKLTLRKSGYYCCHVCQDGVTKLYYCHRFIYECMNNKVVDDGVEIDHIDRDPANNPIDNLREANRTTNTLNRCTNREVDELPEDAIKIVKYNQHHFNDLHYSPSTNCMYKESEGYLFEIPFRRYGDYFSAHPSNTEGKPVSIYLITLRKSLDLM